MVIPMKAIMDARIHALEEALKEDGPFESCGVVVNDEYHPCKNIAQDPKNYFKISSKKMLNLMNKGKIQMVFHSHPNGPSYPSKSDMISQINSGHNFAIIPVEVKEKSAGMPIMWGPDVPRPPLLGRQLIPGIQDCYTIVRDYYKERLDIDLPDFPRDHQWWEKGENLYEDHFKDADFVEIKINDVTDLKLHDVILMHVGSPVPNHALIFLGNDSVMHHFGERLSEIEESGVLIWRRNFAKVVRHKSLLET